MENARLAGTGLTDDAILGGRLRLKQPRHGHRFGHDAVLLAAATAAVAGDHVVELGAGVGAAGLALAARVPGVTVTLVEVEAELADLAAENARRNALADRVRVVALDVAAPARAFAKAGLRAASAAHVMMNPPFNDPRRQNVSPDPRRRLAHEAALPLSAWTQSASRLLASRGVLTLIWRADGLADVLAALGPAFGTIAVLLVHPRPDAAAIRVIVRAEKGGAGALSVLPGFFLNDNVGGPTEAAETVLRQAKSLPLAAN